MSHRKCRMKKAWSNCDVTDLISMYKCMPCLWEVNSPGYKDRDQRNRCISEMALRFNTTSSEITRKIHNLRSQFHSEKQKLLKKKTIYGNHYKCVSKWPHFDSLRFLKRSLVNRFREEFSDYQESRNDAGSNENLDNLGGGAAEPTSTVNVKQEPVDIIENDQDLLLMVMKNGSEVNDRMEAHSSNTEHVRKQEPEPHCSKMHFSTRNNCKSEAASFSRSEPYYCKTEAQSGLIADTHNNRSEIHVSLPEPHCSRSECCRAEPIRLLKIEPNSERLNRRGDLSEVSPFMAPDVRRQNSGRNDNRHHLCRHRTDSISSSFQDPPSFNSTIEIPQNGQKREKQWSDDDQYEIFGKYVASELRSLNSEYLKRKMKRGIQRVILDICEEQDHHL